MLRAIFTSIVGVFLYFGILFTLEKTIIYVFIEKEFITFDYKYADLFETIIYLFLIAGMLLIIKMSSNKLFSERKKSPLLIFLVFIFALIFRVIEDPLLNINNIVECCNSSQIIISHSLFEWSIIFFNIVILSSIFEEMIFRQFFLSKFISIRQEYFGVFFTSILFSLIHLNFAALNFITLFSAFIFSIVVSILFKKYGLWSSMLFHSAYNLLWFYLEFQREDYIKIINELKFNTTYWLIITIGFCLFFIVGNKLRTPLRED